MTSTTEQRELDGQRSGPLVLTEMNCDYSQLVRSIQQFPYCRNGDRSLPPEITHGIADFFVVEPVVPSNVIASRASSSDGSHDLQACLDADESTWWISHPGTTPNGRGSEFVEFVLSSKPVRLSSLSIKIPPLPVGPLSVRTMKIECLFGEIWTRVSPVWTVENKAGWQKFNLQAPIDARTIRLVCLTNQMSQFLPPQDLSSGFQFSCVGYFCVKFE